MTDQEKVSEDLAWAGSIIGEREKLKEDATVIKRVAEFRTEADIRDLTVIHRRVSDWLKENPHCIGDETACNILADVTGAEREHIGSSDRSDRFTPRAEPHGELPDREGERRMPGAFVGKKKARALEVTMFGIPVGQLNRDELLATIGHLMGEIEREKLETSQHLQFIRDTETLRKQFL